MLFTDDGNDEVDNFELSDIHGNKWTGINWLYWQIREHKYAKTLSEKNSIKYRMQKDSKDETNSTAIHIANIDNSVNNIS